MNRRNALKNIGLSAGYIAATPTLVSLLQSCKNEYLLSWTPELFSMDEAKVLDHIVDLIIPETDDMPGAKTLNVPAFIDKYIHQVLSEEEGQQFKAASGVLLKALNIKDGVKTVDELTREDYDVLLEKYLKSSKAQQQDYRRQLREADFSKGIDALSEEAVCFNFLAEVRDLSIMAFKTSEYIGEEVMAYLPIPGEQIGCDSIETLTQGKAWSL